MRLWGIKIFFFEFISLVHDFRELLFEFGKIGTHLIQFDSRVGISNGFIALSIELIIYLSIRDISLRSWRWEFRLNVTSIFDRDREIIIDFVIVAWGECGRIGVISIAEIWGEMWVWGGHSWGVYNFMFFIQFIYTEFNIKSKKQSITLSFLSIMSPIKYYHLLFTF